MKKRFVLFLGALSGSLVKGKQHLQVQDTVHRYSKCSTLSLLPGVQLENLNAYM